MNSFLTANQHVLGYLVPYRGMVDLHKDGGYNRGYLAMIKMNHKYIAKSKRELAVGRLNGHSLISYCRVSSLSCSEFHCYQAANLHQHDARTPHLHLWFHIN